MREIKFRAWDKENDTMIEDVGIQTGKNSNNITISSEGIFVGNQCLSLILMQFTGMKDKNGKRIYEGDVVKGAYWLNHKEHRFIGTVEYAGCSFRARGVKQYKGIVAEFNSSYEIIGNIYENPELLNSKIIR